MVAFFVILVCGGYYTAVSCDIIYDIFVLLKWPKLRVTSCVAH